jgi:regulator of protease activity HflC (stomatin/prohibitin superfamily)
MRNLNNVRSWKIGVAIVGLTTVALVVLPSVTAIVPTGQVGLMNTFGQIADKVLQPGFHIKSPATFIVYISTQTQEFKETIQSPSKEGLPMDVDISVLYRIDPDQAKQLYQTVGENYKETVLIPPFRALIRTITAQYNAQDLYTGQRQAVATKMRDELAQAMASRGIVIEETPLRNIALPANLRQTIEGKLQAEQEVQKMQFVIAKEKQEADRKRIQAQGEADAQKLLSQGLSDPVLRFRQIEAMQKLADSKNAKVVVVGGDGKNLLIQP